MLRRFGNWLLEWFPSIVALLFMLAIVGGMFFAMYKSLENNIETTKYRCELYMEANSDQHIFWEAPNCVLFEDNKFTVIDLGVHYE